jgi:SP family general alpha glucoside:H+ symporter-like MFS transporter
MHLWNFFYYMSVGPICFVLLCECSATRVRSKTIEVATAAQGYLVIVMTVAIPYLINSSRAYLKVGMLFIILEWVCCLWAEYRVPETKDQTKDRMYDELDLLFARIVPARQFEEYKLEECCQGV